jgi:hypothetical protein
VEGDREQTLEIMETDDVQERDLQPSFSRKRTWSIVFHVVLSSLALLALVIMANYLAHRHNQRLYLSGTAAQKLSPLTLQVLSALTNKIKVTVFFDRREPLFGAVANLAKEYQARCPNLELEFVDYRMPGRADAIRTAYKLQADGDASRVIFDSGAQVRTVLSTELSDYAMGPGQEIRRTGFKGEQLFTSAILNLTESKPVKAYFLQGHGEHRLSDEDQGYSRLAQLLENNNIVPIAENPLIGTNPISDDCGLLVIAGPTRLFEPEEIAKIDQYLARGGRLLALFNVSARVVPTGLESLLLRWNVQVGFDLVQDTAQSQSGESSVILTSNYGTHPIVRSLLRSSVALVAPRSISPKAAPQTAADVPRIAELLFSSPQGRVLVPYQGDRWAEEKSNQPIPLAIALERGAIQGVRTDRGATRVVAVGDSLFLSNILVNRAANADFANLAVNWLINRDRLLNEIGPRAVSEYQILLTEQQMSQLRWLFLGAIPGITATFGFFVWLRRRV